jgi:hypothetical protein
MIISGSLLTTYGDNKKELIIISTPYQSIANVLYLILILVIVRQDVFDSLFDKFSESAALPPGQTVWTVSSDEAQEGVKVDKFFAASVNVAEDEDLDVCRNWLPEGIVLKDFFETIERNFSVWFPIRFLQEMEYSKFCKILICWKEKKNSNNEKLFERTQSFQFNFLTTSNETRQFFHLLIKVK